LVPPALLSGRILAAWSILHVLSIDIAAGAAASGAMAAAVAGVEMRLGWWILLPLSVWVIYTADHLLDGWKAGSAAVNPRHSFHFRHMRILSMCALCAAILCAGLAFFAIREVVLAGGVILICVCALHLALARWDKFKLGKEFSVAAIYTAGVWFGPLLASRAALFYPYVFLSIFLLAAVLNLVMSSVMDAEMDEKEGMTYLLRFISPARAGRLVQAGSVIGVLLGALLAAFMFVQSPGKPQLWLAAAVLAVLCAAPGLILRFAHLGSPLYRIAGEGVFLLGFVPWLSAR